MELKVMPQLWGFIPLWQRGIKGDFKIMLRKSPPCLSMTGKGLPKRGMRVHWYYLNSKQAGR